MSRKKQKNLSDSRGNALGIVLLKGMMYFPGLRFTGFFIWVISFFYLLFDRKSRAAAAYYLQHRFSRRRQSEAFLSHLGIVYQPGAKPAAGICAENRQMRF